MEQKGKKLQNKSTRLGQYLGKKAKDSVKNDRDTDKIQEDSVSILTGTESVENVEEDSLLSHGPTVVRETPPKPRKSLLKKLSIVFMVLTVISTVYAGLFVLAPIIIVVPAFICYVIWFVIVAVVSLLSIGLIWLNDGWKDFAQGFLDFNNGLWDFANHTSEFLESTFLGTTIGLSVCVICSVVISTIGATSKRFSGEKFKASMIASIILALVFVAFTIFNVYFIQSGKTVL